MSPNIIVKIIDYTEKKWYNEHIYVIIDLRKVFSMVRISDRKIQQFEIEHAQKVRNLGAECTLFLRRDGSFPIKTAGKIALFGNGVRHTLKGGTGSGNVYVRHFVNAEKGFENAGFEIMSKEWLDKYDALYSDATKLFYDNIRKEAGKLNMDPVIYGMGRIMSEPEYSIPVDRYCDTAIYVLSRISGEGSDRNCTKGDILLTDTEKRNILDINSKYDKFMLVLNVGGIIDLSGLEDVQNILLLGQLGMATGDILADIVTGKAYPSGKLTMTWADINDYPSTEGFGDMNDTYYKEGIYVGYRYFETVGKKPVYPFGYGLGYTDFSIEVTDTVAEGTKVTVSAKVTNTGNFAGKEVVQVYFGAPSGKLERPAKELVGFCKTPELKAGMSADVSVSFDVRDMAGYDVDCASYILEKGNYVVYAGNSVSNVVIAATLVLNDTVVTRELTNICEGDVLAEYRYENIFKNITGGKTINIDTSLITTVKTDYSDNRKEYNTDKKIMWSEVMEQKAGIEEFVGCLSNEELAKLCIGAYNDGPKQSIIGMAAQDVAGAAGQTSLVIKESHGLGTIIMADGPAGLRLNPSYRLVNGIAKPTDHTAGEDFVNLMEPDELQAFIESQKPSEAEAALPEYYQNCVAIPIGTEIAQSFNLDLAKECGDIVGTEMEMFGVHLWLAPALNIHRSPLCGRNFEYYSEDPLVSGLMAAAMTDGVQSHQGCATTIKHYACNNQETNRYTSNSIVGERALREIYLRGFEICIRNSMPLSVMTSYNLLNGEHTCNSMDLNTKVLRKEWGYEGFVMTDWVVTRSSMHTPGSKYSEASAAGCVKCSNDVIMPGHEEDFKDILDGMNNSSHPYHITRADLQNAVIHMLTVMKRIIK